MGTLRAGQFADLGFPWLDLQLPVLSPPTYYLVLNSRSSSGDKQKQQREKLRTQRRVKDGQFSRLGQSFQPYERPEDSVSAF